MQNANYILYTAIALGGISFILLIWIIMIEIRLKKIFRGKGAKDLEKIIIDLSDDFKKLDSEKQEIEEYLENVESRLRQSIQHVRVVRFNPFGSTSSNQSFVVALLNEKGDGAVISSFYSREGVRVYSKPINNYNSEYSLSEEEKEAIKK